MTFVKVNRITKDGAPIGEPADRVNMFWVDSYNECTRFTGSEIYFHDESMWYVAETPEQIDEQLVVKQF